MNANHGADNGNPDFSPCERYLFSKPAIPRLSPEPYDNDAPRTVTYVTLITNTTKILVALSSCQSSELMIGKRPRRLFRQREQAPTY